MLQSVPGCSGCFQMLGCSCKRPTGGITVENKWARHQQQQQWKDGWARQIGQSTTFTKTAICWWIYQASKRLTKNVIQTCGIVKFQFHAREHNLLLVRANTAYTKWTEYHWRKWLDSLHVRLKESTTDIHRQFKGNRRPISYEPSTQHHPVT